MRTEIVPDANLDPSNEKSGFVSSSNLKNNRIRKSEGPKNSQKLSIEKSVSIITNNSMKKKASTRQSKLVLGPLVKSQNRLGLRNS